MKIGLSCEGVNWNFPVLKRHLAIYNICHTPVCEGQYHPTSVPNFPVFGKVESRRWRAMSSNPYFTVSSDPVIHESMSMFFQYPKWAVILSREIRNAELAHLDSIATQRKPNLCR
jgi:hypothetical protein